jgi:autoinducer 2-degrading protein
LTEQRQDRSFQSDISIRETSSLPQIAIIVEFETLEGHEEAFTHLISEHARLTLQEEEGCLRFEVIKPIERDGTPIPNKVMVNELYADEPAVIRHEKNPRMPGLQAATGKLLASRRLIIAEMR